jgi:hypothetical protein
MKSMLNDTPCVEFGSVTNVSEIERIGGMDLLIEAVREGAPMAGRRSPGI